MTELTILKVGSASDSLRARRGDFEHYFAAGLGVAVEDCRIVDPRHGDAFPPHDTCRAVVVTGSPAMITDDHAWSRESAQWLREGADHGTPMLGICYGHQLLAQALGGRVGWTVNGKEMGTVTLDVLSGDGLQPFWPDAPRRLTVQTCHSQSVHELPPDAQWLVSGAHDPIQGFGWKNRVWGFQFHPEFDADIVRTYIEAEREGLRGAGRDPEQLLEQTRDDEDGANLLRAFARFIGAS